MMTEVRIPTRSGLFRYGGLEVKELPLALLPDQWWNEGPRITQSIGNAWMEHTSVLAVPSIIVREEKNYVINPEHDDFGLIEFGPSVPFRLDQRLSKER
jgi:RES domain-containing protein